MKHDEQWKANQSAGVKLSWQNPSNYKTTRKQSPEHIYKRTKGQKGRKMSQEAKENMSRAQKALGRKLTEEQKDKIRHNFLGTRKLTDEQKQKRNKAISESRKGTHGFGRVRINNPNHFKAKKWTFRDPFGKIYEFQNLQSWARDNECLFMPDDRPESKLPLWKRFVSGANGMRRNDKKGQTHWRGWTLVSCVELAFGGADIIGRDRAGIAE